MAAEFENITGGTSTTSGTGPLTISGELVGRRDIRDVLANGAQRIFTASCGSDWMVWLGTYSTSGTRISVDEVYHSSNSDDPVSWSGGLITIEITARWEDLVTSIAGQSGILTQRVMRSVLGMVDPKRDASDSAPITIGAFGNSLCAGGLGGSAVTLPINTRVFVYQASANNVNTGTWEVPDPNATSILASERGCGYVRNTAGVVQATQWLAIADLIQRITGRDVFVISGWKGGAYSKWFNPAIMGDTDATTTGGQYNMWWWVGKIIDNALTALQSANASGSTHTITTLDAVFCDIAAGDCLQTLEVGDVLDFYPTTITQSEEYTRLEASQNYADNLIAFMEGAQNNTTWGGWSSPFTTKWYFSAPPNTRPEVNGSPNDCFLQFDGNARLIAAARELCYEIPTPRGETGDAIGVIDDLHWNNRTQLLIGSVAGRMYLQETARAPRQPVDLVVETLTTNGNVTIGGALNTVGNVDVGTIGDPANLAVWGVFGCSGAATFLDNVGISGEMESLSVKTSTHNAKQTNYTSGIGHVLDTGGHTYSSTAKLLSVQNNTTEVLSVRHDGYILGRNSGLTDPITFKPDPTAPDHNRLEMYTALGILALRWCATGSGGFGQDGAVKFETMKSNNTNPAFVFNTVTAQTTLSTPMWKLTNNDVVLATMNAFGLPYFGGTTAPQTSRSGWSGGSGTPATSPGAGTTLKRDDLWTGGVGSTGLNMNDVVKMLKQVGIAPN